MIASIFNLHEGILKWSHPYGEGQMDELMTMLIILVLAFTIFSIRRMKELKN
jgi:hypothetical protein